MLLKNDAIYIQTEVDVVSFDGTAELDTEYVGVGREIIFVLRKNTTKRYFIKEIS